MEILTSKKFKVAAAAVGVLILMFISFSAGIFVGFKKARFSYSWGEKDRKSVV